MFSDNKIEICWGGEVTNNRMSNGCRFVSCYNIGTCPRVSSLHLNNNPIRTVLLLDWYIEQEQERVIHVSQQNVSGHVSGQSVTVQTRSFSIELLIVSIWDWSWDPSFWVTAAAITGRVTPQARPNACFERTFTGFTNGNHYFIETKSVCDIVTKVKSVTTHHHPRFTAFDEGLQVVVLLFLPFKSRTIVMKSVRLGKKTG